jgi:hypothetical protein
MALTHKGVLVFKCVSDAAFPSFEQILRQMRRTLRSATGESQTAVGTHKNKYRLRNNIPQKTALRNLAQKAALVVFLGTRDEFGQLCVLCKKWIVIFYRKTVTDGYVITYY